MYTNTQIGILRSAFPAPDYSKEVDSRVVVADPHTRDEVALKQEQQSVNAVVQSLQLAVGKINTVASWICQLDPYAAGYFTNLFIWATIVLAGEWTPIKEALNQLKAVGEEISNIRQEKAPTTKLNGWLPNLYLVNAEIAEYGKKLDQHQTNLNQRVQLLQLLQQKQQENEERKKIVFQSTILPTLKKISQKRENNQQAKIVPQEDSLSAVSPIHPGTTSGKKLDLIHLPNSLGLVAGVATKFFFGFYGRIVGTATAPMRTI